MEPTSRLADREPVVIAQLVQTVLISLLGLLAASGAVTVSPAVAGALVAVYVAIASVITYVLRGRVYSPATVAALPPPPAPEFP